MRMRLPTLAALVIASLLPIPLAACEGLHEDLGRMATSDGALDESTIAAGLREALQVGMQRAVDRTSKVNGFRDNRLIRIAMPDELEDMADALRKIGFDDQVDELETSMNRAAEKASGEVVSIFWEAISAMTIDDARRVLEGGKRSATKLLRERTSARLSARIEPIVSEKMDEVGLSRLYDDLAARYDALPFGQDAALDLDDYVTGKTLDGLFTMLGKEEERIRKDPVARTTELLRRVFE